MLVAECEKGGVTMRLRTEVLEVVSRRTGAIRCRLNGESVSADSLVIASGGLSMRAWGLRLSVIKSPSSLA